MCISLIPSFQLKKSHRKVKYRPHIMHLVSSRPEIQTQAKHNSYCIASLCVNNNMNNSNNNMVNISNNIFLILKVKVAQSCLTPCNPLDCSPPGSSIHEVFHARIVEWVAISYFRGSSSPRDQTQVSGIAGRFFTI